MHKFTFKEDLLIGITRDYSNEDIIHAIFTKLYNGTFKVHRIGNNYLLTLGKEHYLLRISGNNIREKCQNIIEYMEPVYKVHI